MCGQYFSVANVVAVPRRPYLSGVRVLSSLVVAWPHFSAALFMIYGACQLVSTVSLSATRPASPCRQPHLSTVVHRPFTPHSLTHRPSSPLLHVDYHYLLPHRSACDLQRCVRSHYFAATVATYRAAYCQLFSIPLSLPLYNRHFRSLYPLLTHNF